jgi:hypothetical protein
MCCLCDLLFVLLQFQFYVEFTVQVVLCDELYQKLAFVLITSGNRCVK